MIGDAPIATAILDRLQQHAKEVQTTGSSYRLRCEPTDSIISDDGRKSSNPGFGKRKSLSVSLVTLPKTTIVHSQIYQPQSLTTYKRGWCSPAK